jgi:hypothetical protein
MQLHETFIPHPDWGGQEAAADGDMLYLVCPMFYNARLIVVPRSSPEALYGWCFKSAPYALAALAMWEPDIQDEPLFWHKRAGEARLAPHREKEIQFNLPRCRHGSYLHDGVCDVDPLCSEMPRQGSQ